MSVRFGFSLVALLSFCTSHFVFAQEEVLTVKKGAPTTYTVVKGDTLWDISALYLDSPWLWPRLWQVNPEIDNPHLIYPGDKLSLVWRNGQPVLSLKPMVKLSPKVRVLDKKALPTINESLVLPYLESDRLLTEEELSTSARVLGSSDGDQYLTNHKLIYITGEHNHSDWVIYRPLDEYQRDTHKMTALKQIAKATLTSQEQGFSGLEISVQNQEILADDIALPVIEGVTDSLSTTFYPAPSPAQSVANLLGSLEGSHYVGQNQVVVIDRGDIDQLRQGSMFELYSPGAKIEDGKHLPDTFIGHLMVIRPYEHFSLALVTQSAQPISQQTLLRSPLDALE
ncbi:LysM peptidoglycan-binding domain-containing protein [Vibrio sinaloensis]|uniref:Peptidoglycan-binding protein n=1 Tax=Photobacterium sp. (strain ATCC 43367) TaxID=379097 RepID=A0A0A5HWF7_PHOS4|nr:LysM peptidoglycan-binding domain-containing protein [Vibrio sinaloensis]KGY07839.1 peptidoglycan-binding protein [Vibrio sinaloensis]